MAKSEKQVRRIYWKDGHSEFFGESSGIWGERVVICYDHKTKKPIRAEYLFLRANPILRDGYKYEIDEALEREGWGAAGIIAYKENIPFSQLPECRAFKEAYQETYESIIKEAARDFPESEKHTAICKDLDYTVSQFLDMVKKKFEELKKKMPKIELKGTGLQQLREIDRFLGTQGFKLYNEEWEDEETQKEV